MDHFEDYVTDVRWHPIHPGTFSVVDASGMIEVWNLNENMEGPVLHHQSATSWHRCAWDRSGEKLITANIDGQLALWRTAKFGFYKSKNMSEESLTL